MDAKLLALGGGAAIIAALMAFRASAGGGTGETPAAQNQWYDNPPAASVGWFWTPRVVGPGDYPLDTDFGLRFIRPRRGVDFFPYPGRQITADLEWTFMGAASYTLPQGNVQMVELGSIKRATVGPYPNFEDTYVHSFTDVSTPTQRKTG